MLVASALGVASHPGNIITGWSAATHGEYGWDYNTGDRMRSFDVFAVRRSHPQWSRHAPSHQVCYPHPRHPAATTAVVGCCSLSLKMVLVVLLWDAGRRVHQPHLHPNQNRRGCLLLLLFLVHVVSILDTWLTYCDCGLVGGDC